MQPTCNQDPSRFVICLDITSQSGAYEPWFDTINEAAWYWEQIINDAPYSGPGPLTAKSGDTITVKDIYVDVSVGTIDGVGNVLGRGGPTFVTPPPLRITRGRVILDEDDLTAMIANGSLLSVVIHEM